ncbi:hypothetical protein [Desulfovibrio inopinatus]|uniref:hypothetical protein n=1 Tax=Desulfovibrio inopinatus TaxID=102109 RepID=UPI000403206C|nr:hypothetical protein [Desulfovibrio inopinatus]
MLLNLRYFQGEAPRYGENQIAYNQASLARNTNLRNRNIKGWKDDAEVMTPSDAGVITFFKVLSTGVYLTSENDVDAVFYPSGKTNDRLERLYLTGWGDVPQIAFHDEMVAETTTLPAEAIRPLGIPAPDSVLLALVSDAGTGDEEDRYYVYTFVSDIGEEGPASDVSNLCACSHDGTVQLSNIAVPPIEYTWITNVRIYRTLTTEAGATEFFFVAEIDAGLTTYADSVTDSDLVEPLYSTDWLAPAEDMTGLIVTGMGSLAGFRDNEVCFSEPYYPHAWPEKYRYVFDAKVVGLGVYDTTVVVCTEEHPYLMSGSYPDELTPVKLPYPQGCVSKRGIISMGSGVLYPSPDGIIQVAPDGSVQNITSGLLKRRDWQAMEPKTIRATFHDGFYLACYGTPNDGGAGFIFDPSDADATFTRLSACYTALAEAGIEDALYAISKDAEGNNRIVLVFGAECAFKTFTWKSADFLFEENHTMTAFKIIGRIIDECDQYDPPSYGPTPPIDGCTPCYLEEVQVFGTHAFLGAGPLTLSTVPTDAAVYCEQPEFKAECGPGCIFSCMD